MDVPFFEQQLNIVDRIASWREPWLDSIFLFLNYFDSPYFFLALIPLVWVGFSYKWGIRLSALVLLNGLINYQLKQLFDMPRPCCDSPGLGLIQLNGPGFPSGAAEGSMLLGCLLAYTWKNYASYVTAGLYILIISFSRLYLGVHYPLDILGGWVVGLCIFFAYVKVAKKVERVIADKGPSVSLVLCGTLSVAYILAKPTTMIFNLTGGLMGMVVGVFLSLSNDLYLQPLKLFWQKLVRGLAAVATTAIVYSILPKTLSPFTLSFILALWVSWAASPLCKFVLLPKSTRKR
jgi:membrane-associated phospholipid phosphatase